MSVSVRVRFEVFKRDRFTCSYCGRTPPNVLLEVDHIVPRAAGGSDELPNLTTSCWECNSGKSSRLLEEGSVPTVNKTAVQDLSERIEQATAYTELVAQMEGLLDRQVSIVIDAWAEAYDATTEEREGGTFWRLGYGARFPDSLSIRRFLRVLTLAQVLECVEATRSRLSFSGDGACRYFYGCCHRARRDVNGRP